MAKQFRDASAEKSYDVLHKRHQQQMDKAKKLVQDKQEKELEECTFAP